MTCQECLSLLATSSVFEIGQDRRVLEHGAHCDGCRRAARLIVESERDLGVYLDSAASSIPATRTAEAAMATVKRRRVGRVINAVCAALFVAMLIATWQMVIAPRVGAPFLSLGAKHTETLRLRCLSPADAGALIEPYLRSDGSFYYKGRTPMQLITVRANAEEMRMVKSLLLQYDFPGESKCALPQTMSAEDPSR
ncbi:MAG: hypothetical protein ABJE47_00520 [bacterium]